MLDAGALSAGSYPLEWNGKDSLGETVDDGAYSFDVKAYNASGEQIGVEYRSSGKVTGISFDSGTRNNFV